MKSRNLRHMLQMFGGALLGLTVVLAAQQARAQATQTDIKSDINGNFDFKLGPYYPSIDEEFNADPGPFETSFGTDNRIMAEIASVYYLWQGHGKLGVGGRLGYTRFNGSAQIEDGSGDGGSNGDGTNGGSNGDGSSEDNSLELQEETRFTVFPLGVIASYRWDFLVTEWGIPLAPKVGAGLDYYLWKVADGSGNVATVNGSRAAGGTPGYHLNARIEFLLDWVDPQSAANFDMTWGINNTYLFAEFNFSRARDVLDGTGFRLGDESWRAGLAFEF